MPNLFDDVQSETPDDGNIFNAVPASVGGGIFDSLKGGPLLDRTATDNWRSTYTTPAYEQASHARNIFSTVGAPATTSLPADHFSGNTSAPSGVGSFLGRIGGGLVEGAKMGFEGVPASFEELGRRGPEGALSALFAPITTAVSGGLGALEGIPTDPSSPRFRQNVASQTDVLMGGLMAHGGPAAAERGPRGGRAPAVEVLPKQLALEGPARRALPEPAGPRRLAGPNRTDTSLTGEPMFQADLPMGGPIARPSPQGRFFNARGEDVQARPPVVDTTARPVSADESVAPTAITASAEPAAPVDPFRAQIDASLARQRAKPTPTIVLADRAPISTRDTGGGAYSLNDLVRNTPEQVAAQRGEVTPAQQAHADNLGIQVADRQAAALSNARDTAIRNRVAELAAQPTESAAPASLHDQLAASLRAKGRPDLIVGETKPKSDYVASNPRLSTIHDANEAVIAAARSGDLAAAEKAMQAVKDAGGSLDHTRTRLAQAGVQMPTAGEMPRAGRRTITLADLKVIGGGAANTTRADLAAIRAQRAAARSGTPTPDSFDTMVGDAGKPKATLNEVLKPKASTPKASDPGADMASLRKQGLVSGPLTEAEKAFHARTGTQSVQGTLKGSSAPTARPRPAQSGPTIHPSGTRNPTTLPSMPPPTSGGRGGGLANLLRKVESVTGVGKTLTTAASPFHFMFRHALPAMVAHPQAWAKGSVKGLREGFTMNPRELTARQDAMRSDPVIKQYGTYIGKPHGGIVSGEESVPSTFLNRVPILGKVIERSGQGFVQGLNEVRYLMTQGIDAANPGMTAAQKASMGETINTFTGRGIDTANMGDAGKAAMRAANVAMFSPQMLAARLKMLAYTSKGMADVLNNVRQGKTPDPVALERARLGIGAMTGMGLLYGIGQALGGKTDTNPVSTTFGQTDMGPPSARNGLASLLATELGMGASTYAGKNTMLNPTESESTQLRTMARMAVAIYDAATQQKNLQKMEGAKTESTPGDIANHWVWSLFSSPLAYPIAQFLEYGGRYPTEPLGPVTPMVVGSTLTGAGVEMPTVGGKPSAAPKAGGAPAPTVRPGATTKPAVKRLPMPGEPDYVPLDETGVSQEFMRGANQVGFGPQVRSATDPTSDNAGMDPERVQDINAPRDLIQGWRLMRQDPEGLGPRGRVTGIDPGAGGLHRPEDAQYQSSDRIAAAVAKYLPADMQAMIANRKFERVNDTSEAYGSQQPMSQGGFYDPTNGRIVLGRGIEQNEGQGDAIRAGLHEALHAISEEHPAFSYDTQHGYPRLREIIASSPNVPDSVRQQAETDPGHAFTAIAQMSINGAKLPPALADYFAPFKKTLSLSDLTRTGTR